MDIKQKNKMWNITVDQGLLIVTTLYFVVTAGIFFVGVSALNESVRTNNLSEKNYQLAKESYESSAKDSKERFELEKANAQAQIDAMKEQVQAIKNQFEIEHTPYLTIRGIKINQLAPNKLFDFDFEIMNIGKYPVKVISIGNRTSFAPTNGIVGLNDLNGIKMIDVNYYVTNQYPFNTHFGTQQQISNETYSAVIDNKITIWWIGEMDYVNLINNQKRKFRFIIKFNSIDIVNSSVDIEFKENENLPIKN